MLQLERTIPQPSYRPPETPLTYLPIYQSVVVYRQSPDLILVEEHGTNFIFSCSIINNMTGQKLRDVHFMFNRPATLYYHKSKYKDVYYVLEYSEYFNALSCSCQESRRFNGCRCRRNVSDRTGLPA